MTTGTPVVPPRGLRGRRSGSTCSYASSRGRLRTRCSALRARGPRSSSQRHALGAAWSPTGNAWMERVVVVSDLASLFELEPLAGDRFRTSTSPQASGRLSLYGGLVTAQALRAAGMTVSADRAPHSLHAYFLRPGRVDEPVVLSVDRDRDGASFSTRHVRATQRGDAVLSMVASFQRREPGVMYDAVPTRGGGDPGALPSRLSPLLVEIREATATRVSEGQIRHSDRLWVRAATSLPGDPLTHACAVAYMSDLGSGFGQMTIDGLGVDGPSIDHSVWFHTPLRGDEWMLLELWPLKAGNARGVYCGSVRSSSGLLGAVLAQEMLLRDRALPPGVLQQMAALLGLRWSEKPGEGPTAP
jgi:acyl-CoA thioesterase II